MVVVVVVIVIVVVVVVVVVVVEFKVITDPSKKGHVVEYIQQTAQRQSAHRRCLQTTPQDASCRMCWC